MWTVKRPDKDREAAGGHGPQRLKNGVDSETNLRIDNTENPVLTPQRLKNGVDSETLNGTRSHREFGSSAAKERRGQ